MLNFRSIFSPIPLFVWNNLACRSSCLQINTALLDSLAFHLREQKEFLCTVQNVRLYHSCNMLGNCCNLELVQAISCPWGFNLLSFHHTVDHIFDFLSYIPPTHNCPPISKLFSGPTWSKHNLQRFIGSQQIWSIFQESVISGSCQ